MSNLVCYIGLFGAGKSYALVQRAIELADRDKLIIVSNVWFDMTVFNEYCDVMKYRWSRRCRVIYVDLLTGKKMDMRSRRLMDVNSNPSTMLSYPNSVILFDEGGIHLNARFWKDTGKDFLSSLFQLRHDNKTVLFGYQFFEQVDKQLREVIQMVVSCTSVSPRDKSGRPRMVMSFRHFYEPLAYAKILFENPSPLSRWVSAMRVDYNVFALSSLIYFLRYKKVHPQKMIFEIYNSFAPSKNAYPCQYIEWIDDRFDVVGKTGLFL